MTVRIALIGLGYMGLKHLEELLELHDEKIIELTGIADADQGRLMPRVELKYALYTDFYRETDHENLIEHADAAVIATPNETHFEIAKKWLDHGKHILVEKPICTTSEEARTLLQYDSLAMPGNIYRFSKLVNKIEQTVNQGRLGKIEGVNLRWITPIVDPQRDLLLDLLPHCLDIIHHIFGEPPVSVAKAMAEPSTKPYQHACIQYFMHKAYPVWVEIGRNMPEKHRSIEIMGDKLWLSADVVKDIQYLHFTEPNTGKTWEEWVPPNNTLRDELFHFIRTMDKTPPNRKLLLEMAMEDLELIEKTDTKIREAFFGW